MRNGAEEHPATGPGKLGKFRQLVELQGELVAQARKNEQAEQQCDALWRELERTAQPGGRATPLAALARRLAGLRERLVGGLRKRALDRRNGLKQTDS
jgi:hypothetical protein